MTFKSATKLRTIWLATAAALLVTVPSVAFAQDNDHDHDRGGARNEHRDDHQRQAQPQPQQAQPAPQQAPRPQGRPQGGGHEYGGPRRPQAAAPQPNAAPQAGPQRGGQDRGRDFGRSDRFGGGQQPQQRPHDFGGRDRQAGPPSGFHDRPDFRGRVAGPDFRADHRRSPEFHAEIRRDWHSNHDGWDRGTIWRRDPNWWRGNPYFRDYRGPRVNFFFAPGYGYYDVPAEYYARQWRPGDYLPEFFLDYAVQDYGAYGLPPPPDGCIWVWVNNNVLLVDTSDGYIMDEVDSVW